MYNYVSLNLWTCDQGATEAAQIWSDPVTNLGTETGLGSRKSQIQKNLIQKYHSKGIKVLVSVFGAS